MTLTQDLYSRFPTSLQNLACNLEGWRIQRRRYSPRFFQTLREVESRGRWSDERCRQFRDDRLASYLRDVAAKAPFYQRRFREAGCDSAHIQRLVDLSCLPILTKREVQDHQEELSPQGLSLGPSIVAHTSGTTGGGLKFTTTIDAEREQWAVWWRYRRLHGIDIKTWCGYFAGRSVVPVAQDCPPFWRVNHPGRQVMFSGYHMSPANLPAYVAELRRRKLPWLHGYPSLLVLLAAYLLDTRTDLGYQVRWITIGAENLLPQQAQMIRQALGTKPRQHYGMAEGVANISECERGRLHVDEDFAAVEFVPTGEGQSCRVVGTNFSNPATPLVRYDVGDVVTLLDEACPCNRPGRLVARVDGRQEDYVMLRNGVRVGRMDHIFKDLVRIHEAQIYQVRPGELIYRIVRGNGYGPGDEQRLLQETRLRLGDGASIQVEYVDSIARTSSGKLRFVVSEIREGQLETPALAHVQGGQSR